MRAIGEKDCPIGLLKVACKSRVIYQVADSKNKRNRVIGGLYLRNLSVDVYELRPAFVSLCLSAMFVLPLLWTLLPFSDFIIAAVSLAIVFMVIPLNETIGRRLGFSVGASVSILTLAVFLPSHSVPQLWVLSLPSALVFIRPYLGGAALFAIIAIGISLETDVSAILWHLCAALMISGIAFALVTSTVDHLHRPIRSYTETIISLVIIYVIILIVMMLWFGTVFVAIQNASPDAFQTNPESSVTFIDLIIYAGIIYTSGEPVYLAPVSIAARVATLAEMIVSLGVSTIYFAVVISKLLDSKGLTKGG